MRRTSARRLIATTAVMTALTGLAVAGTVAPAGAADPAGPKPVEVKLLALNDFHGNLEPPGGSSGRIGDVHAGGVEYLDSHLDELRDAARQKNTITVAAGDLIGASPLLSAAFHDEPAIEALSLAGLDYASVGNHEFDEGADELLRIQHGGCHPEDGCSDPELPYAGADFQYLSANAFVTDSGEPLLAPYAIHQVQGVRVGFIGMTLEQTPEIVTASGVAGLTFADEVDTANRYTAELQEQGVEAIVVLLHQGGFQAGGGGINECNELQGPIVPISKGFSAAIDVVVSGHTHAAYNCEIDGKLVTSASSFGRLVTDIDLQIDRRTGDVVRAEAENVVVTRDVEQAPAQTSLIERYRELLGPIANEQVGLTSEAVTRQQETLFGDVRGEAPLGNLIADAQLAATDDEQGAVAAFMNPGGVRADLDAGPVTYEEAFTVQPFNNYLTTLDLTGAQLYCLLEEQFLTERVLYPSAGLSYTVAPDGATAAEGDPCSGSRIVDGSLQIGDVAVKPAGSYRITVNSFLADGGDGFTVLPQGMNRVVGGLDIDAFTDHLPDTTAIDAPATDRIAVAD
jgi:5'-nucleotidase